MDEGYRQFGRRGSRIHSQRGASPHVFCSLPPMQDELGHSLLAVSKTRPELPSGRLSSGEERRKHRNPRLQPRRASRYLLCAPVELTSYSPAARRACHSRPQRSARFSSRPSQPRSLLCATGLEIAALLALCHFIDHLFSLPPLTAACPALTPPIASTSSAPPASTKPAPPVAPPPAPAPQQKKVGLRTLATNEVEVTDPSPAALDAYCERCLSLLSVRPLPPPPSFTVLMHARDAGPLPPIPRPLCLSLPKLERNSSSRRSTRRARQAQAIQDQRRGGAIVCR